jgi:hypothetical protein
MAFTEEEIRIVQQRRAARAAREAREAAGLPPEEPAPPKKRRFLRRLGKLLLLILIVGLATPAAAMVWHYGTLSPCGALTQALHGALLQEAGAEALTSADTPSPETNARSRFPAVDRRIESLSPVQCTEELVEFERLDEQSFMKAFFAQPTP